MHFFGSIAQNMDEDLQIRLLCLHYDLMHFSSLEQSRARLESACGKFYMSDVYFTAKEQAELCEFVAPDGRTAEQTFKDAFAKKDGAAILCTSHDIAPLYAQIYGIQKKYETQPKFKRALKLLNKQTQN